MYRKASITTETSGAQILGTEAGFDRVATSPQLLELLGQFCVATTEPEACFANATYIGTGYNSEIREVDGMAIKLSTDTTGQRAWLLGTSKPENLLNQFRFMSTLAAYFSNNAEVTAPEQYLALRSRSGSYLSVQQYMNGWQSLQSWLDTHSNQATPILANVKGRIKNNVNNPLIRLGMEDLGLHRWQALHTKNIMVPGDAEEADEVQLCIIDQPSQRVYGRLAVAGLGIAAKLSTP